MTQASNPPGSRAVIILAIAVGFILVPYAARFAPVFVNGLLLLILIGTIVGNTDRWLPTFTRAFGGATVAIQPTHTGAR